LSDNDFIKDLFQEQLGNMETPVNPDLWAGIQSQLGNVAASSGATATGAAAATKGSVIAKIAIAASIVTTSIVGTVYLISDEEPVKQEAAIIQNEQVLYDNLIPSDEVETTEIEAQTTEVIIASALLVENDDNGFEDDPITSPSINSNTHVDQVSGGDKKPKAQVNDTGNAASGASNAGQPIVDIKKQEELEIAIFSDRRDNQHYRFRAESNGENSKYAWDFGDGTTSSQMNPEHFFGKGGNYQVSLTVIDGERAKTVYYQVEVKTPGKFTNLPTIFTPNNDGSNDEFFVESKGFAELTVIIINQKNDIVYESNDIDFRWDGRDRRTGLLVDKGVYYYMISAIDKDGNNLSKHNRLEVNY
jgi:gliding motility-associated-like protein